MQVNGYRIAWTLDAFAWAGQVRKGTDDVCTTCYGDGSEYASDTIVRTYVATQGAEEISCSVCGECIQDGPDPEPEPEIFSKQWGYL